MDDLDLREHALTLIESGERLRWALTVLDSFFESGSAGA
jgi:hypothetical protein